MFGRITKVVKHLLIINILVFIATVTIFEPMRGLLALHFPHPDNNLFRPYQFLSHFFMHGNEQHLIFNMLSLVFIGPIIEKVMGEKRFLNFYILCAFGASFLDIAVKYFLLLTQNDYSVMSSASWGASGAIYGILVAFAYLFPNQKLMLLFPPIPIQAKYLVTVVLLADFFFGISGISTGIGHFAHIGGAAFGFFLVWYWYKRKRK